MPHGSFTVYPVNALIAIQQMRRTLKLRKGEQLAQGHSANMSGTELQFQCKLVGAQTLALKHWTNSSLYKSLLWSLLELQCCEVDLSVMGEIF